MSKSKLKPLPNLSLLLALRTFGLEAEFIRLCKANTGYSDLTSWLRKQFKGRVNVPMPKSLRHVRTKLGCPGAHGGYRPAK